MSVNCSFIEMPAEKLRHLAQNCLDRIDAHKRREIADTIAKERSGYEKSWFRRLFRMKVPSDAEIKAGLSGGGAFSTMQDIDMYAWGSKDIATKLLKACEHSQTVHVSVGDLDMIA